MLRAFTMVNQAYGGECPCHAQTICVSCANELIKMAQAYGVSGDFLRLTVDLMVGARSRCTCEPSEAPDPMVAGRSFIDV